MPNDGISKAAEACSTRFNACGIACLPKKRLEVVGVEELGCRHRARQPTKMLVNRERTSETMWCTYNMYKARLIPCVFSSSNFGMEFERFVASCHSISCDAEKRQAARIA